MEDANPSAIPANIVSHLNEDLDRFARLMTRRIADELELPPEFHSLGTLRATWLACRDAITTLFHLIASGGELEESERERLGSMGQQTAERGIPLEVLLSAYRLAAKVVWDEVIADAYELRDLSPETLMAITRQVLEYLDAISSAVGGAYLTTRQEIVVQHNLERQRLIERLIAGEGNQELVRRLHELEVPVKPPYAVLVAELHDGEQVESLLRASGRDDVLVGSDSPDSATLLIPVTGTLGAESTLAAAIGKVGAAGVGPVAPTLDAIGPAVERARLALAAGKRCAPGRRLYSYAEFGIYAAMRSDPDALTAFVSATLGPVLALSGKRRELLLAALDALLATPTIHDAAKLLSIHRHTLEYRIERLSELGIDIGNPESRHELWFALRGAKLLGTAQVSR